ncbi:Anaphase-promoting complex subunit 10 [Frankliniella fusca]|uniref:Anaphase-promoting complex subunit 10 n=1 Tax=Frankliniella fusca TaxID=407009 RepID=A0AAE1HW12_9NEOP|nr:Anaphase-promoting complex subunit 10 [Frankliniella fusca]
MEKFSLTLCLCLCTALVAFQGAGAASLAASLPKTLARLARSVSPSDASNAAATGAGEMGELKVCHSTTPCGWAVYVPFTRRVDYFMKNTCECPKDRECLRTDDDLSVSAYVYRCRTADKQDKQGDS